MKIMLSPHLKKKKITPEQSSLSSNTYDTSSLSVKHCLNPSYGNWLKGCPEHWAVHNNLCYFMADVRSSKFDQAHEKCKQLSAKLPIIKSESENSFVAALKKKNGYGLEWRENRARWFGVMIHQQNHQMEHCTAHGKQMSQVTIETRIVLTWNSLLEGRMITSATMPLFWVPTSFAKRRSCNMDITIWDCTSHCENSKLSIVLKNSVWSHIIPNLETYNLYYAIKRRR